MQRICCDIDSYGHIDALSTSILNNITWSVNNQHTFLKHPVCHESQCFLFAFNFRTFNNLVTRVKSMFFRLQCVILSVCLFIVTRIIYWKVYHYALLLFFLAWLFRQMLSTIAITIIRLLLAPVFSTIISMFFIRRADLSHLFSGIAVQL